MIGVWSTGSKCGRWSAMTLVAAAGVLPLGCRPAASPTSTSDPVASSTITESSPTSDGSSTALTLQEPSVPAPLDEMIAARVGEPPDPDHVAAEEREAVMECGRAKGVEFPDGVFPTAELSSFEPAVLGGYIEPVRALIDDLETKSNQPADPRLMGDEGQKIGRMYMECLVEVESGPPTPEAEFWEWYSRQTQDMAARMEADPRSQAIDQEAERCFAAAGYPNGSWNDEHNSYSEAAGEVESQFLTEQLTATQANARLDEIEAKSNVLITAVGGCYERQLTADAELYAEYQAQWISENAELLNEQLAALERTTG